LISGQPLYLLYSNWNGARPLLSAALLVARATHATGKVRLQVTGRPPTTSGFSAPRAMDGQAAASAAAVTSRRRSSMQ
jgi:hypothetical protein